MDLTGRGVYIKRETHSGSTWGAVRMIANDTQPEHVRLQDHIVLGMSLFDPKTRTSFFFYTACYQKCTYTTTYHLRPISFSVVIQQYYERAGIYLPYD